MHYPRVRDHMTATLHTIGADATVERATAMMRQHQVRHLPVLRGGELLGVVSQRDLLLLTSLPGVVPSEVKVEEALAQEGYVVAPDAPLHLVAREMADRRLGSALVVDSHHKLVGLFTTTDALHALAHYTGAPSAEAEAEAEYFVDA
jgi:acetoin utilization protein AcuB